MPKLLTITSVLILTIIPLSFTACEKQDKKEQAGSTVLRDYVKVPLDTAKIADKKANRRNRQMQQELDKIE